MRKILRAAGEIIQVFIAVLLTFLLVCNLYLIFMDRVMGAEHPAIFGYSAAVVASGSMEPALSVDDLILNHVQISYAEGDIITFQSGDSLTTHRIVEVTDTGYVTKGDANNAPDPDVVQSDAVTGRVIWAIPYAGSALAFLKTPLGMTVLIFAGLCIIELPFLFQGRREGTGGKER